MCGIIGFVGADDAVNYLTDGLTILENRGYDSTGIATLARDGSIVVSKFASNDTDDAIVTLKTAAGRHVGHTVGIGHTRWATHGGKTDANAHPHTDHKQRVAVVHNGVIENSHALRAELVARGIAFTSETDTEVIPQMIGYYLDEGFPSSTQSKKTLARLEGTWGLGIIATALPDTVIAVRNGSPLVIGIAQNAMFLASEPSAFGPSTRNFIALENGEMALVTKHGHTLDVTRVQLAPEEHIALSPAPFPHWTLKEITEQPDAVTRTLNHGARIATGATVKLAGSTSTRGGCFGIRHLVIAACGTSYHAGLYGVRLPCARRKHSTPCRWSTRRSSPIITLHLNMADSLSSPSPAKQKTSTAHSRLQSAETFRRFPSSTPSGRLLHAPRNAACT